MTLRSCIWFVVWWAVAFGGPACRAHDDPRSTVDAAAPVTIFAASSLAETVTAIASEWSSRTGRPHRLQFEASSTLARQIREGAPADALITAAPEWLDRLTLIDRFDWLSNRLVLVVGKDSPDVDVRSVESLALANEQVPAGKYAREALASLGVNIPERTIYGQNVRDVLAKVSAGGARAGIVYATDVAIDPGVRVSYRFGPETHSRIIYSAGLLTPAGRAFFAALREPWALAIATGHGFMKN